MNSIQGLHNNYELLIQQLTASKSGSQETSQANASSGSSASPTDTVQLSLNELRDEFQNLRISYNEKNGNLTGDQAAQLQAQIATVEQTVSGDRQANSGPLTGTQKIAINQMQNQISSQIYEMANNIAAGSATSITG